MTSQALVAWEEERATRLDKLVFAHQAVAGNGPGRRWLTEEINHALIVRLAAEFQGFFRDLHDESITAFIDQAIPGSAEIRTTIRALLENGRKLDNGNANWANIVSDFSRFGVSLARELEAMQPRYYAGRRDKLHRLNAARNAIAHNDPVKLAACEAEQPLSLATFTSWRKALDGTATGVDRVMSAYLIDLTGTRPW